MNVGHFMSPTCTGTALRCVRAAFLSSSSWKWKQPPEDVIPLNTAQMEQKDSEKWGQQIQAIRIHPHAANAAAPLRW